MKRKKKERKNERKKEKEKENVGNECPVVLLK
jgi:hypothetical protein